MLGQRAIYTAFSASAVNVFSFYFCHILLLQLRFRADAGAIAGGRRNKNSISNVNDALAVAAYVLRYFRILAVEEV